LFILQAEHVQLVTARMFHVTNLTPGSANPYPTGPPGKGALDEAAVGLYKLHSVYPQLEIAQFQSLEPMT
jgi:hypothetical protein